MTMLDKLGVFAYAFLGIYFLLVIFALPTYFFWTYLFKKYVNSEKKLNKLALLMTFLVTPCLYLGLIIVWIFSIFYYPDHDFDKQKWFNEKNKRYEMSKNIIESKMLIGKNKSEIINLLGIGDEKNSDSSKSWIYHIGVLPGNDDTDPDILFINFEDGKVVYVGQCES